RPRQHFELNLGIVPEHYPSIIKKQTKAARWNGFKRTWMNAFQPNCQNHEIGDNIYMPGRTHLAMVFKSDMAVFTPDLAPGISVRNVIRNNITRCYSYNLGRDGKLFSLRRQNGKIIRKYINYNDCDPAMLIAFSNHLRATNDWGWALPLLKQTARACRYLLSQDKDNDGILESAFHGNHMDDQRPSINWWDDFAFGHKDAYYNLLAYRALKEMMSVYNLCGRQQLAAEIKKILAEFKKNFSRIFYNPASGVYCGWVSRDGRQHDYMFSFITAMAAIQEVIPRRTARRALNILYQKMRKQGYDFKYGVPGPCIPVDKQDTWVWEPMSAWGRYENGGLCGHTAYYFIQALYQYGMRQKADRILFAMLETFEKEPTHSGVHPGYTKSCDWRTKEGQSCGYNYLADNYYFLLAVITGYCGIKMPPVKAPPAHLVEKMK
ncbi:MAG TPA: GH116 family glycosyl hydrolase, partial [Spirochaetota bacterium]|nr:GH116 family glycosyl hydrolase [Spirochaetota bacterium]